MVGVTSDLILQVGIIVIIAAAAAFLLRLIKQPQILAYVLVGVFIGPILKLVTNTEIIQSMSTIGIAFLLFIVGIEIDLKKLKDVALVSTLGGGVQIAILFISGYLIALSFGYLGLEAAYIGLMLSFSSTMIVMKLLSDKRELNTLHGRIVVGILLMEDIVAIFALSFLTSINGISLSFMGIAVLKFLTLFGVAFLASKFIFPAIFRFAAENQELLLISSLAVCFSFSLAFQYLGFSIAIGAFIAGITLGNLVYSYEIIGKIKSLRDFFALIFFVSLGMGISLSILKEKLLPIISLILFIIIIKPIITMTICSLFKYTKKPAFLTAASLSQVGEFSLIITAQGLVLGHVTQELFSLVVIVTVVTITLTSYLIKYDNWFYKILQKPLSIYDIFTTEGLEFIPTETKPTIILCGHNRTGYSILRSLNHTKKKTLIVDFDPEVISKLVKRGYHCIYGDVTDEEIIERMNLKNINMFISTIPELKDNIYLIKKIRNVNKNAKIIVNASDIDEALKLYNQGADYVVLPHFLGGEHTAGLISQFRAKKINFTKEKNRHIDYLKERKSAGHRHPKE